MELDPNLGLYYALANYWDYINATSLKSGVAFIIKGSFKFATSELVFPIITAAVAALYADRKVENRRRGDKSEALSTEISTLQLKIIRFLQAKPLIKQSERQPLLTEIQTLGNNIARYNRSMGWWDKRSGRKNNISKCLINFRQVASSAVETNTTSPHVSRTANPTVSLSASIQTAAETLQDAILNVKRTD